MIDRATAIQDVLRRMKGMEPGDSMELLTWKRDRSILLKKDGVDEVVLYERGFVKKSYRVDMKGLKRLLKTLLKREFPRSNKIRVRMERGGSGPDL